MFVGLGCALLTNLLGTVFHSRFSMWTHAHKHAGLSITQQTARSSDKTGEPSSGFINKALRSSEEEAKEEMKSLT